MPRTNKTTTTAAKPTATAKKTTKRASAARTKPTKTLAKPETTKEASSAKDRAQAKRAKATPHAARQAKEKNTRRAEIVALLQRPGGATLEEIMRAVTWQRHSCRGFLSTLAKTIVVDKATREDGVRIYVIK
jgi:hypothetical protein